MSENSKFFAELAVTTLETAPGLKGVEISISPVLDTLSTPGFRRREALEECRRLSTRTYHTSFLDTRITVSTVLSQKEHCGRCFLTVVVVVTVKRLEKTFEKVGLTTVDGPTHADWL